MLVRHKLLVRPLLISRYIKFVTSAQRSEFPADSKLLLYLQNVNKQGNLGQQHNSPLLIGFSPEYLDKSLL